MCPQFAASGYCTTYPNIQNFCQVSCKTCGVTTIATTKACIDSDAKMCPQFATAGYCTTYPKIQNYCLKIKLFKKLTSW